LRIFMNIFFIFLPVIPFFIHIYLFHSYEDIRFISFIVILTPLSLYLASRFNLSKLSNKSSGHFPVFTILFTGLICYILFNWYLLSNPYYGNRAIVFFWVSFLSFITVSLISDENKKQYLLSTCIAIGFIGSIVALLEYAGYIQTTAGYYPPQPSGFIGHKNMLAMVLMTCVMWTFFAALKKIQTEKKSGILLLAFCFIQLLALVISDSRGPLLTSLVFLLVIFFFRFANQLKRNMYLRISLYLFFLVFTLLPLILWNENSWFRYASLFIGRDSANIARDISPRPIYFTSMIKLFLEKPVFGIGIGNFIPESIRFWPFQFRAFSEPFTLADAGHNDFLQAWCELGIIGGTLYNFFWFGALFIALKNFIKSKNLESLVLLLVFTSILLHAGYNTASRHVPSSVMAWAHLGLIWRDHFNINSVLSMKKVKHVFTIILIFFSSLFLFLAIQISLGDFYFFKSEIARTQELSIQTQNTILLKSVACCPYHPNANYKLAYFNAMNKNHNVALPTCDYLDEKYPNTLPTDYVRAYCHYHKGNYDSTLYFSNRLLDLWPKFRKVYIYQALAYQQLKKCQELERLKRIISPRKKTPPKNVSSNEKSQPVAEDNQKDKDYLKKLSIFQKKFGGPFIKNAYNINRYTPLLESRNLQRSFIKILELKCDSSDTLHN